MPKYVAISILNNNRACETNSGQLNKIQCEDITDPRLLCNYFGTKNNSFMCK